MKAEAFLAGVRRGTAARRLPDPGPEAIGTVRDHGVGTDLIGEFKANLETVAGSCHEPDDSAAATSMVVELIAATRATSYLSWDAEHLPLPGLLERLAAEGLTRRDALVPADGRREHQLGYFDCAVGITGATAGLAATGSVILGSGRGKPRMASLVPETHIALLERSSMHPSLGDWIDANPHTLGSSANWTVITGPSRTADIEMVITHGVHGPRVVHVVLV